MATNEHGPTHILNLCRSDWPGLIRSATPQTLPASVSTRDGEAWTWLRTLSPSNLHAILAVDDALRMRLFEALHGEAKEEGGLFLYLTMPERSTSSRSRSNKIGTGVFDTSDIIGEGTRTTPSLTALSSSTNKRRKAKSHKQKRKQSTASTNKARVESEFASGSSTAAPVDSDEKNPSTLQHDAHVFKSWSEVDFKNTSAGSTSARLPVPPSRVIQAERQLVKQLQILDSPDLGPRSILAFDNTTLPSNFCTCEEGSKCTCITKNRISIDSIADLLLLNALPRGSSESGGLRVSTWRPSADEGDSTVAYTSSKLPPSSTTAYGSIILGSWGCVLAHSLLEALAQNHSRAKLHRGREMLNGGGGTGSVDKTDQGATKFILQSQLLLHAVSKLYSENNADDYAIDTNAETNGNRGSNQDSDSRTTDDRTGKLLNTPLENVLTPSPFVIMEGLGKTVRRSQVSSYDTVSAFLRKRMKVHTGADLCRVLFSVPLDGWQSIDDKVCMFYAQVLLSWRAEKVAEALCMSMEANALKVENQAKTRKKKKQRKRLMRDGQRAAQDAASFAVAKRERDKQNTRKNVQSVVLRVVDAALVRAAMRADLREASVDHVRRVGRCIDTAVVADQPISVMPGEQSANSACVSGGVAENETDGSRYAEVGSERIRSMTTSSACIMSSATVSTISIPGTTASELTAPTITMPETVVPITTLLARTAFPGAETKTPTTHVFETTSTAIITQATVTPATLSATTATTTTSSPTIIPASTTSPAASTTVSPATKPAPTIPPTTSTTISPAPTRTSLAASATISVKATTSTETIIASGIGVDEAESLESGKREEDQQNTDNDDDNNLDDESEYQYTEGENDDEDDDDIEDDSDAYRFGYRTMSETSTSEYGYDSASWSMSGGGSSGVAQLNGSVSALTINEDVDVTQSVTTTGDTNSVVNIVNIINGASSIPHVNLPSRAQQVAAMLHQDITDMAKSLEELAERRRAWQMAVAERIKEIVVLLWPGAWAEVFGSIGSGLAAPCSDIDLVVHHAPPHDCVNTLAEQLRGQEWVQMLQAIEHTAVPVIKLTTACIPIAFGNRGSLIAVDITFETTSHRGVNTMMLVRQLVQQYPPLKPLTLVLKQFLVEKGLNDPFVGGLTSYGLVIMIVAVIQRYHAELKSISAATATKGTGAAITNHQYTTTTTSPRFGYESNHQHHDRHHHRPMHHPPRQQQAQQYSQANASESIAAPNQQGLDGASADDNYAIPLTPAVNLGEIFMCFLATYSQPAFIANGVSIRSNFTLPAAAVGAPVYIEDPLEVHNNVGGSCFGVHQVMQAFNEALEAIQLSSVPSMDSEDEWSILGRVFSTGHHHHVVNLVATVWCPPEKPMRGVNNELRQWANAAYTMLRRVEAAGGAGSGGGGGKCVGCGAAAAVGQQHLTNCHLTRLLASFVVAKFDSIE